MLHCRGEGVDHDGVKAVALFRESAAQGHIPPMSHLGDCYMDGVGVDKDVSTAVDWYRAAGDKVGRRGLKLSNPC